MGGGDLGILGNFIRDRIKGDTFNKELFERYWLSKGDMTLSYGRFLDIVRVAIHEGRVKYEREIRLPNGRVGYQKTISFYGTKYQMGLGDATMYFDEYGFPIGFKDSYNFDKRKRDFVSESQTRAVDKVA